MAVTRIQNNQITDQTITYAKIAPGTLVGTLFNANLTLASNITIQGNLAVLGESTTISSTNTYVNDPLIVFNNGFTGAPSYDIGIIVNRNLNPFNTAWIWNESGQRFEGIYTTETGGTAGTINNSGFANMAIGNLSAITSATIGNVLISGDTVSTTNANSNLLLSPNGTGFVEVTTSLIPSANLSFNVGSPTAYLANVYVRQIDLVGASMTTDANGNLLINSSGVTTISNLSISGSGNSFSGNLTSSNVNITGGSINNTTIGATAPAAGTFTSIVDTGNFTASGSGAQITLTPTGTGSVTINPATTGSINNMSASLTTLTTSGTTSLSNTTATSLTTANAQITGGAISGTPISGSTGSFTTLAASGTFTASGNANISGSVDITSNVQSTSDTTGALVVAGGVGIGMNTNIGGNLDVLGSSTLGNILISGNQVTSSGNVVLTAAGSVIIGNLTMPQIDGSSGAVMTTDGNGHITLQSVSAAVSGNAVTIGTPSDGSYTNNNPAILTFTSNTTVADAVDLLNTVLGKLVPPAPPSFPNGSLSVSGLLSGLRMTNFTQTNNTTTGSKQLTAGSTVSAFSRSSSYSTNIFTNVGPGSSGNINVVKNSLVTGSHVIVDSATNNGTYGELIISNNVDYGTIDGKALGFWYSFDVEASGSVPAGWNEVYITDSAAGTTNTYDWYYDASAPGTPVVTTTSFTPSSSVTAYSSGVPHYTSATSWSISGTANRLSGDLYPASDTFLTGAAGGSFQTPASLTYTQANITTPLAQNLYVASGNVAFTTSVNTVNSTGSSSAGVVIDVSNSYSIGSATFTPGGSVLTINTSQTTGIVNENNVTVGSFGSGGTAYAVRVGLPTGSTPVTSNVSTWSSSAALPTYEAAVVAGVASNNVTNYSTGYFPVGPDYSTGRTGTQYITFVFDRAAVSKFDVALTGKVSGCQVAMTGSPIDTSASPTNGWIDATVAYSGAGLPGTGSTGNGSVGCALGGTMVTGSSVTQSITVTFGTASSSSSTNNAIYVRFILNSGDNITALSFNAPTH